MLSSMPSQALVDDDGETGGTDNENGEEVQGCFHGDRLRRAFEFLGQFLRAAIRRFFVCFSSSAVVLAVYGGFELVDRPEETSS